MSYIAPEIPVDPRELAMWKEAGVWQPYTAAVDMWALGCTIVAMLAGELPFISDTTRAERRMGDFEPPNTACHQYSAAARSAVCTLLKRDPAQRPTADAFLQHPWFTMPAEELRPGTLLVTRWATAH